MLWCSGRTVLEMGIIGAGKNRTEGKGKGTACQCDGSALRSRSLRIRP